MASSGSQFVVTWPMILLIWSRDQFGRAFKSFGFAGVRDFERSVRDFRLKHIPCAFEEQECVVVSCSSGIKVKRLAGTFCMIDQVLRLRRAYCNAVERDVVVYCVCFRDQTIIGNDFDFFFFSRFDRCAAASPSWTDDQYFDAFVDQCFYVFFFFSGRALAEQNFGRIFRYRLVNP